MVSGYVVIKYYLGNSKMPQVDIHAIPQLCQEVVLFIHPNAHSPVYYFL